MSITAIRITTTVRIDRIETYSKNAAVLPNSSIPQKARIGDRMQVTSSQPPAHQPYHQHNHSNGSKHSVTEHLISPYKLRESVYAYLPPLECRFSAIPSKSTAMSGLPRVEMDSDVLIE